MDPTCPKCGHPRSGESCPKCGVVFERFDESALKEGVPGEVLELWRAVEEEWDNQSRHALFVEQALANGVGGYAAACYRKHLEDERAEENLALINKRLEQLLLTQGSPPRDPARARLLGAVALVILLGLLWMVLRYLIYPA